MGTQAEDPPPEQVPTTQSIRQLGAHRWVSIYQGIECAHDHLSPKAVVLPSPTSRGCLDL